MPIEDGGGRHVRDWAITSPRQAMRNGEMHFLPLPRAISTLSECNNSGSFIASRLAQCLHAVCSLRGKPRGKVWIIGEKEWVMNQDSATKQSPRITWMLGGLAFGVVAMYLSDPERGRRRRGLAIDKMRSAVIRTGDTLDMVSRDLGDRVQGLRVRTSNMLSRRNIAPVDDRILMARVRQKIGRAVSNPHAIEITARQGCIILSGPVLAHERQQLLDTVRRVHGVSKLEDRLQIHEQADGIASLQGSAKLGGLAAQGSRTPALRIVALIGATTLGMLGGMRRRPANLILAATGLALMMRSISNMPFKRSADIAASRRVMDFTRQFTSRRHPRQFSIFGENTKTFLVSCPMYGKYAIWVTDGRTGSSAVRQACNSNGMQQSPKSGARKCWLGEASPLQRFNIGEWFILPRMVTVRASPCTCPMALRQTLLVMPLP